MNTVPFMELKRQYAEIKPEIDAAIKGVFEKGMFILGENVSQFEKAFAKYCNAKHCISTGSGTEALHIALLAAGVGPNDEVIVPSHTFVATALAITYCGAKPVFVDINEDSYCIGAEQIKKAVTSKTKAIIPVHLYGQYADMDAIKELAEKNNISIVEDACQSHGAEYKGKKKVLGKMACYSFYPTKNLGAYGDGGAIVTDDDGIAEKIVQLRNYGEKKKYEHTIKGYNSRLDELQAAMLLVKLKHLDSWVEKRRKVAEHYNNLLGDNVIKPKEMDYNKHSYYIYAIRSNQRDQLQQYLKANGISTIIHYPIPIHKQKAYSECGGQKLPVTEKVASEILSLPMFPEMTKEEVETVAELIRKFR